MTSQDNSAAQRLPRERAFVVQLDGAASAERVCGRVVHVRSGEESDFASLEALLAFMLHSLAQAGSPRLR